MACFYPLHSYIGKNYKPTFKYTEAVYQGSFNLPCGQCLGCRLERSRQWAVRCVHEASLYTDNCFITLTYDDAHLPTGGTLVKKHFQLFMKRLRKRFPSIKIRFFHVGEYGSIYSRPHYHALLFNFDFPDKVSLQGRRDNPLFVSSLLDNLWGKGYCSIGFLNFATAGYVARYCLKKITGELADDHYSRVDETTGELFSVLPEYATMSRRPGIGKGWFDKYQSDCFPSDEFHLNGLTLRPPKYYDRLYEPFNPALMSVIKHDRLMSYDPSDNTPARLLSKELYLKSRLSLSPRKL